MNGHRAQCQIRDNQQRFQENHCWCHEYARLERQAKMDLTSEVPPRTSGPGMRRFPPVGVANRHVCSCTGPGSWPPHRDAWS